jgi:hypothetical protein
MMTPPICHTEDDGTLIYRGKNDSGQIMHLGIHPDEYQACIFWDVCFWIGKRKRGYEYMNQTGRDGIKSLLWAKSCIKDFIEKYEQLKKSKKSYLCINWDDNRRRNAYLRGLKDLGFKYARVCNEMLIVKPLY